jgi:uncharacterized membrane protein YkvA (DUF1232 family)
LKSLKERAKRLKAESYVLYLASKDKRVPWYAKLLAGCILAYLLSPIDLIPDFIPVIGYLDDIIIIPAGISLVFKMIPREVLEECKQRAHEDLASTKGRWIAAAIIGAIWILLLVYLIKILVSAI